MKRIAYLLSLLFILASCGSARQVSYTYRPLMAEGCSVSYSVVSQEGTPSIVVTVSSDRLVFCADPVMTLKNFKGDVLKLSGINLQSRTETGGIVSNNVVIPVTDIKAMAQFPIDKADITFFESGISKVRLSTVPIVHEREFSSDQIGKYLFKELTKASKVEDDF